MAITVAKFGGTSLANTKQILKVKEIIQADERRKYVVPSAPGKRTPDDEKVTDLLYLLQRSAEYGHDYEAIYKKIRTRFIDIRNGLGLSIKIEEYLEEILEKILAGADADYAASRGEFLNGLLLADLLGHDLPVA